MGISGGPAFSYTIVVIINLNSNSADIITLECSVLSIVCMHTVYDNALLVFASAFSWNLHIFTLLHLYFCIYILHLYI